MHIVFDLFETEQAPEYYFLIVEYIGTCFLFPVRLMILRYSCCQSAKRIVE